MKNAKKIIPIILILPLFIVSLSFSGCTDNDYGNEEKVFGSLTCTILINGGNSQRAGKEIFELMKGIDSAVSTSNRTSAIFKFNDNDNKTVSDRYEISLEAYEMAVNCKEIYEEAKTFSPVINENVSVFNPAIYPLVEAWGVSSDRILQKNPHLPDDNEIAGYLSYCKYEYLDIIKEGTGKQTKYYIAVTGKALEENPEARKLKIDFGAYAKGYAADKAVEICRKYNVKYGWINISGNLILIGTRPDGQDWPVRIGNPFIERDDIEYFCRLTTKACSPVSSGVYVRYYSINGQGEWMGTTISAPIFSGNIYVAHIIDPATGMPVNLQRTVTGGGYSYSNAASGIVNATVFSESSAVADAYATIVTVLGMGKGIEFLEEKGLRGIIVAEDGNYAVVGSVPLADETGEDFAHNDCKALPGYWFNK